MEVQDERRAESLTGRGVRGQFQRTDSDGSGYLSCLEFRSFVKGRFEHVGRRSHRAHDDAACARRRAPCALSALPKGRVGKRALAEALASMCDAKRGLASSGRKRTPKL